MVLSSTFTLSSGTYVLQLLRGKLTVRSSVNISLRLLMNSPDMMITWMFLVSAVEWMLLEYSELVLLSLM